MNYLAIEEVHWELTNHCNFRCVHCYLAPDTRSELTTEQCLKILSEMERAGVLYLTLSGGEPLLRKDFSHIYQKAHQMGFLINVFTNGSKITDDIISLWKKYPPHKVEITVNGFTKDTLESITCTEGSFEKIESGIKKILDAGIFLGVKTNGMTLNKEEIKKIKSKYQGEKVFYKFDTAIMPRRDHHKGPLKYRLAPNEILNVYKQNPEMQQQMEIECQKNSFDTPENGVLFSCSAGSERFHISAWGDLHPCHTVRPIYVSLLNNSFIDAALELKNKIKRMQYPKESKCHSCKIFSLCDSCPGLAELEGKTSFQPATYHCDVAHQVVNEYKPEAVQ